MTRLSSEGLREIEVTTGVRTLILIVGVSSFCLCEAVADKATVPFDNTKHALFEVKNDTTFTAIQDANFTVDWVGGDKTTSFSYSYGDTTVSSTADFTQNVTYISDTITASTTVEFAVVYDGTTYGLDKSLGNQKDYGWSLLKDGTLVFGYGTKQDIASGVGQIVVLSASAAVNAAGGSGQPLPGLLVTLALCGGTAGFFALRKKRKVS